MGDRPAVEKLIAELHVCRQRKNLPQAMLLLAFACEHGLDTHTVLGNHLVPAIVECGSLPDAVHLFHALPHRNEYSWSSLVLGYVDSGEYLLAFELYEKMREGSVLLNGYVFVSLLKACVLLKDVARGQELCTQITRMGWERLPFVGNALVDMYGKCGLLPESQEMFGKLLVRDVVSWTALITGYADHGLGEEAWSSFNQMCLDGVVPDAVTFVCCLKACCTLGSIDKGQEVLMHIVKKGLEGNLYVGNALVDFLGKYGSLAEAWEAFRKLPARDIISWNSLIARYVEHGFSKEALEFFLQMQLEEMSPNAATYTSIFKACGSVGAMDIPQELHASIIENGFESELPVVNTLVDVYGTCGFLDEAYEACDKLVGKDVVTWNALIAGYNEHGFDEAALNCFELMQLGGILPDIVTFDCSLKACGSMDAPERGLQIVVEIVKKGVERDPIVARRIIAMFARHGSLNEAEKMFDLTPVQDTSLWAALIEGYVAIGLCTEALDCLRQVQVESMGPDTNILVCGLKVCSSTESIGESQKLHAEIVKKGLETDILVGNMLLDVLCKCGLLIDALYVFDRLLARDIVSWNAIIAGYIELGCGEQGLSCFEQMHLEGVCPDDITIACILKACGSIGSIERGQELHATIVERGLERDLSIGNTLVDMFGKCALLVEAQDVFSKLPVCDVVSWNALITGYVEHGFGEETMSTFNRMHMEKVCPNSITFVCGLKACSSLGALEIGREVHAEITKRGLETELYMGNALVDIYAKCMSLAEAKKVSDHLPARNIVSWSVLIAQYTDYGFGDEALNCLEQMQIEGACLNANTCVCSLKACGMVGALERGREMHAEISKLGFWRERFVGNSLIDMYSECGSLGEGRNVFESMLDRDVVSWNAMIKGYGENHEGDMAIQCFEAMLADGVKPDAITFTCLLVACSRASLVLHGQDHFNKMRADHGIEPNLDHVICLVDLLARSGNFHEAERFAGCLQCYPSEEILTVLLNACKLYGKVELGQSFFQQLICVNPEEGAYLLMSDVYVSACRWNDATKMEEVRKLLGAKKKLANSLIEVDKRLYEFVVGDNKSKAMPLTLSSRMRDAGHVSNLDLISRHFTDEEGSLLVG